MLGTCQRIALVSYWYIFACQQYRYKYIQPFSFSGVYTFGFFACYAVFAWPGQTSLLGLDSKGKAYFHTTQAASKESKRHVLFNFLSSKVRQPFKDPNVSSCIEVSSICNIYPYNFDSWCVSFRQDFKQQVEPFSDQLPSEAMKSYSGDMI